MNFMFRSVNDPFLIKRLCASKFRPKVRNLNYYLRLLPHSLYTSISFLFKKTPINHIRDTMTALCMYVFMYVYMYRVSQEEWTKLRESVLYSYVELYRYNPKHLLVYPKLNGHGDNGQRILKL